MAFRPAVGLGWLRNAAVVSASALVMLGAEAGVMAGLELPLVAQAQNFQELRSQSVQLNNDGEKLRLLGQWQAALEKFEQALEIVQKIGEAEVEGAILNNIGQIYQSFGQYDIALSYLQKALANRREVEDRKGEAVSLNNVGSIYRRQSQYDIALNYLQKALVIRREVKDRRGEAFSLNSIGLVYANLSQYSEALEYYQRSLRIRQELQDHRNEAISLNNIGGIYDSLGQYDVALGYYQKAIEIQKIIPDAQGQSLSLNNIGVIYQNTNQYQKSLTYYQQSLEISRSLKDLEGQGKSLNNIGTIYRILGQYREALSYYYQSIEIHRKLGNRQREAVSLNNIGVAYLALSQYDKALDVYQQALTIQKEIEEPEGQATSLSNIAYTLNLKEQFKLAVLLFKQSVSTYETIRADIRQLPIEQQKSYTTTIEPIYRKLADLLLQQDRILEAQQVLDLLKVQELEDYLQNTRSSDSDDLIILKPEQEILDRYQQLQTTAIEIGQELTQLRQRKTKQSLTPSEDTRLTQLLALETDINAQFNAFIDSDPIQALLDQLSRKTLQQTLPLEDLNALRDNLRKTNAALIYPLILEDRLELILTTPDSPPIRRTVTNFDSKKLRETIVAYRSALQSPNDLRGTKQLAQQLYDWLIAPLEADLEAAKPDTLIYAPDGILRYIPLAALYDEKQPDGEKWLAQRYATNNIVAKSLTEFDTAPANNPRVLAGAWGNQSHSIKAGDKTFRFGGIPFTLSEVESLAKLLPTEALLEQNFSHDNLTAKDLNSFNIIHLATHGKFVTGNAANSFLALGSGEAIPLPEIKDLTMTDVDLVVLSACETGVGGNFGQGEEILGLGYQFQRAGAKAALASLWQVDDGGTQRLMVLFYAALRQGMTKAAALQTAQQALITSNYEAFGSQRASLTWKIHEERRRIKKESPKAIASGLSVTNNMPIMPWQSATKDPSMISTEIGNWR